MRFQQAAHALSDRRQRRKKALNACSIQPIVAAGALDAGSQQFLRIHVRPRVSRVLKLLVPSENRVVLNRTGIRRVQRPHDFPLHTFDETREHVLHHRH